MTIETGALEQAYAKLETSYFVIPADTLSATDGIRHLQLAVTGKKNREASPEKRGTPDRAQSLPRRESANFNLSEAMWEPSGTLGTISYLGKLIKAAMGSNHVLSLSTTVASGGSVTGATLTSAAGVQVGDLAVVTLATPARREITRITSVAGVVVTWDTLSAAPATSAPVVVGITYNLANTIADSFAIYKYYNAGNFKEAVFGAVMDQMGINFDGTKEVQLTFQGPAARYGSGAGGATVQAKPGAFTTVGSPIGGMVGNFYVDGVAFLVSMAKVSLNNNLALRNKELGTAFASGIGGRNNLRDIKVDITCYLEDTNLLGKAHNVTKGELRCIVGDTNGSMVGMVAPSVEFEIPDVGNEIGLKEITISGIAYAISGNDQLYLMEA